MHSHQKQIDMMAQISTQSRSNQQINQKTNTYHTFGKFSNRMDENIVRVKNYGDLNKINQINNTDYNLKQISKVNHSPKNMSFTTLSSQRNINEHSFSGSKSSLESSNSKKINSNYFFQSKSKIFQNQQSRQSQSNQNNQQIQLQDTYINLDNIKERYRNNIVPSTQERYQNNIAPSTQERYQNNISPFTQERYRNNIAPLTQDRYIHFDSDVQERSSTQMQFLSTDHDGDSQSRDHNQSLISRDQTANYQSNPVQRQYDTDMGLILNSERNYTSTIDFQRKSSSETRKLFAFTPVKVREPSPDKLSGKKKFTQLRNLDTKITQLVEKTSETGFTDELNRKRKLRVEKEGNTFMHVMDHSNQPTMVEGYNFRNIISGSNMPAVKSKGIAMVNGSVHLSDKKEENIKVQSRTPSANQFNSASNIFFLDNFPDRNYESYREADAKRNTSLNQQSNFKTIIDNIIYKKERHNGSGKKGFQDILMYNSEKTKNRIHQSFKEDEDPKRHTLMQGQGNRSMQVRGLLLDQDIFDAQPKATQDYFTKVLDNHTKTGKLLSPIRNLSLQTKQVFQSDQIGTPKSFTLQNSCKKISSRHESNSLQQQQSTRNKPSHSFFN